MVYTYESKMRFCCWYYCSFTMAQSIKVTYSLASASLLAIIMYNSESLFYFLIATCQLYQLVMGYVNVLRECKNSEQQHIRIIHGYVQCMVTSQLSSYIFTVYKLYIIISYITYVYVYLTMYLIFQHIKFYLHSCLSDIYIYCVSSYAFCGCKT